jgi:hypothetical protein
MPPSVRAGAHASVHAYNTGGGCVSSPAKSVQLTECFPCTGGKAAVVLANLEGNRSQPLTLTDAEMPPTRRGDAGAKWDVVEAFSGATKSAVVLPTTVLVPPHDVAMWVLTPASPWPT